MVENQHAQKPRSEYRAFDGGEAESSPLPGANISTRNVFRFKGLSKPKECPHGETATIFWARGANPFKDALGDLAGSKHSLRLGV